MCEGEYCVVCFVGYGLPIGCCIAGGAMTCYGCYRYYFLTNQRRIQEQQQRQARLQRNAVTQQPLKADTLKRSMLNKFLATLDKLHGIENIEQQGLGECGGGDACGSPEKDPAGPKPPPSPSPAPPDEPCPICYEDYDGDPDGIFMGVVKECQHYFHFDCLWEWLEHNSSCPLCRTTTTLTEQDIMGTSFTEVQKLLPEQRIQVTGTNLTVIVGEEAMGAGAGATGDGGVATETGIDSQENQEMVSATGDTEGMVGDLHTETGTSDQVSEQLTESKSAAASPSTNAPSSPSSSSPGHITTLSTGSPTSPTSPTSSSTPLTSSFVSSISKTASPSYSPTVTSPPASINTWDPAIVIVTDVHASQEIPGPSSGAGSASVHGVSGPSSGAGSASVHGVPGPSTQAGSLAARGASVHFQVGSQEKRGTHIEDVKNKLSGKGVPEVLGGTQSNFAQGVQNAAYVDEL